MNDYFLTGKEFLGQIIPKNSTNYYDSKLQGRYRVYIPELMPHIENDQGIFCKNHVTKYKITGSHDGEYGQYFPLHPGTYVIVKFQSNDFNSGYIDRIVSDYKQNTNVEAQDCVTPVPNESDRDEQTILIKTPKKNNIFYINENTKNEPNTIYLIYNRDENGRNTVFRINPSGITIWTRNNIRERILKDSNVQIDKNKTEYVKQNKKVDIDGSQTTRISKDFKLKIEENGTLHVTGDVNITVNGTCNVYSDSEINCDGSRINLNCGKASAVEIPPTQPQKVRDLGPNETSEYNDSNSVGDKCDDATNSYNNGPRSENDLMWDR